MKIAQEIKKAISVALSALGTDVVMEEIALEHPTVEEHGDYSTNISLKLKIPAQKIVDKLPESKNWTVSVAGQFINFKLSPELLVEQINAIDENFGRNDWGKGQTWLLEHTSPNPNKAMHLGHLRNNLTGMAIGNLWEFSGVKVIRDCIDNDRGIAICRLMWGYLKFARRDKTESVDLNYWFEHQDEWSTPDEAGVRPDRFVDELYVKASEDFKNNKDTEEKVRQMVVAWESDEPKNRALWERVMNYSHSGQELTLKRLGSKWDWVWHEHEHYQMGKDIVEIGLKREIFKKSEGAIVTDLEKYNLPNTVVIKSDGTALYITQDLALTKLKREKFQPDKIFWVIGPEQTLALKQLFAVCEQLGFGTVADYTHIPFGWMSIKGQGKMSSRLGTVVYIDELIDMAKDEIIKIGGEQRRETAEQVAIGAVKYSTLRVGRIMDTAFDFKESLNFEGDSGPYLQYTFARAKSVLRKSSVTGHSSLVINDKWQMTSEELSILRWIYRFPEVVELAAKNYAPNLICSYLFELAKRFNNFYNNCPIISDDKALTYNRLLLTSSCSQVLKNGLYLLGIEALEKM